MNTYEARMKALWRDDPTEASMSVDLRLDAETGSISAPWDLLGAFDLDSDYSRPFILRRDGKIDFGLGAPHRWRTNLRGQEGIDAAILRPSRAATVGNIVC